MISRKPAHLLLVDDDPGLLKLLGMRLTSEGYSVVTAESGQEGLRVLNREKVDLVISDLRMDEMDGMQLFTEIQKVQLECRLSSLLLTVPSLMPLPRRSKGYSVFSPSRLIKTRYTTRLMAHWNSLRQPLMTAGVSLSSPAAR